jgi:hypothetical protein
MRRRPWTVLAMACAVAAGGCPKKPRTDAPAPPPSASVPDGPAVDSGSPPTTTAPPDLPEGGSIFFATIGRSSPHRFYFQRSGSDVTGFSIELQDWATPTLFHAELLPDHRFRLTSSIRTARTPAERIVVDGAFVEGRGLVGTRQYASNAPEHVSPDQAVGLGPDERTFDGAFEGVLGAHTRLRAKLRAVDGNVTGVYRYTSSKSDLRLAGTIEPVTRRITLTETNAAGTVTGRLDGLVVSRRAIAGQWRSPDGARALPFRLTGGAPYPETQALAGGVRVVPQEWYRATADARCTVDVVFPEIAGLASPEVVAKLNHEWKRRAFMTPWPGANDLTWEGIEKRAASPAPPECPEPMVSETHYTALPLARMLLAVELEHYDQFSEQSGNIWSDCAVADLETGEQLLLQEALGPAGREKLGDLVAASLHRETSDAGAPDYDPIYHRVEADTHLCATPAGLRVMIYGNRVMGPFPRTIPYATVAPLFPPGKLRAALTR